MFVHDNQLGKIWQPSSTTGSICSTMCGCFVVANGKNVGSVIGVFIRVGIERLIPVNKRLSLSRMQSYLLNDKNIIFYYIRGETFHKIFT
jgi:hypothetical protein